MRGNHPRFGFASTPVRAGRPVRRALTAAAVALLAVAATACGVAEVPGTTDARFDAQVARDLAIVDAAREPRLDRGFVGEDGGSDEMGAGDGGPDGAPDDLGPPLPDAFVIDMAPPVPTCLDDDADGDGYGVGPTCPEPDCDDANAAIHPGAVEACNGLDDDCDGRLDEDLYTARCGVGACRRETPNCLDGRPNRCTPAEPGVETCNGEDDDCDGTVDESASEVCGLGICQRPAVCTEAGPQCTPGDPSPETCNGADDDCDGVVDEGQGRPTVEVRSYLADLASRHPPCDGLGQRMGADCNAAIHRHCAAQPCQGSGFGPVENTGDTAVLTCLPPAEVVGVSFATLATFHEVCNGAPQRIGPDCNAAIHRFCRSRGHVSGFGPLESGAADISVACVGAGSEVLERGYAQLATRHDGCNGTNQRIGPNCNAAIHRECAASGFTSGFGPVENSGGTAYFTCVRTP